MGRSNKEARLNHSGYTIESGHGGLKRNRSAGMADGASIQVGGPEEGSGMAKAKAKQGGGKAAPAKPPEQESTAPEDGDAGWDQIGKAGSSMVQTYQRNKAAKGSA